MSCHPLLKYDLFNSIGAVTLSDRRLPEGLGGERTGRIKKNEQIHRNSDPVTCVYIIKGKYLEQIVFEPQRPNRQIGYKP